MIKGITTTVFDGKPAEYMINQCAHYGLEAIQVALPFHSTGDDRIDRAQDIIEIFLKSQTKPVCIQRSLNLLTAEGKIHEENLSKFFESMELATLLEHPLVSFCGTSVNRNMWEYHEATHSAETWQVYLKLADKMLNKAEQLNVYIAFEPYVNSPLCNTESIRSLLETLDSDYLKLMVDPCNIFRPEELTHQAEVDRKVTEYLETVMERAALVHFKDVKKGSRPFAPDLPASGKGILNYDLYCAILKKYNYQGVAIIEHLQEEEIDETLNYLKRYI